MRILPGILFCFLLSLVSCHRHDGPTNEYKNAKTHSSDTYAKDHKKAAKKAQKDGQKTMRKARKEQRKKQRSWFKKGSYQ